MLLLVTHFHGHGTGHRRGRPRGGRGHKLAGGVAPRGHVFATALGPLILLLLKKIGFAANRRLLGVQRLSHDCTLGADVLDELHRPVCIDGQRASALRFGDRRVQALFAALLRFDLLPQGFRNRDLRETVAALCGLSPDDYGPGRMTYDLRRLRLRGIIERIPRTQRYRLTAEGLCVALAYHRTQA